MSETYVLDFRGEPIAGPVVPGALYDTKDRLLEASRLRTLGAGGSVTFLLHGFNNRRAGGRTSLLRFAQLVRERAPALGTLVAVLWPGDDRLGPLTYSIEERDADATAKQLAWVILDAMIPRPSVSFVAHSLGCRVVLETMTLLSRRGVGVREAVLMAGALDADALARSTRYRAGVERATRVSILCSQKDKTLRVAFPAGDFLASILSGGGYTTTALGLAGPIPAGTERVPLLCATLPVTSFDVDHGHYLPGTGDLDDRHRRAARFTAEALLGKPMPLYDL